MSTEKEQTTTLTSLIALLQDGEKGFRDLAMRVESPECRSFLLEESARRGRYALELEAMTQPGSGGLSRESGTFLGTMHRQWTALKATVGVGDYELLRTTEVCEWFAVKAYSTTLRDKSLPVAVLDVVADQVRGVHASRETVQELRRLTKE